MTNKADPDALEQGGSERTALPVRSAGKMFAIELRSARQLQPLMQVESPTDAKNKVLRGAPIGP